MNKVIQAIGLTVTVFLFGCSRQPTPDFQHLEASNSHNYYLACPDKYCNITPNVLSPVYPVSAADLYNYFNVMVSKNPDINFVYEIPEQGQFGLIAYLPFIRLPDDVTVQFIALSDNTSTVAIYSRSRYLIYDFGLNQQRVDEWLIGLKNATHLGAISK